jgi:hypothetical protein
VSVETLHRSLIELPPELVLGRLLARTLGRNPACPDGNARRPDSELLCGSVDDMHVAALAAVECDYRH